MASSHNAEVEKAVKFGGFTPHRRHNQLIRMKFGK